MRKKRWSKKIFLKKGQRRREGKEEKKRERERKEEDKRERERKEDREQEENKRKKRTPYKRYDSTLTFIIYRKPLSPSFSFSLLLPVFLSFSPLLTVEAFLLGLRERIEPRGAESIIMKRKAWRFFCEKSNIYI